MDLRISVINIECDRDKGIGMRKLFMKEELKLKLKVITIKLIRKLYYSIFKVQDSSMEDVFCLEELENKYIEYYAEDNRIIS